MNQFLKKHILLVTVIILSIIYMGYITSKESPRKIIFLMFMLGEEIL